MSELLPKTNGKPKGALAERRAIACAHHARVAEPSVRTLLKPGAIPVVDDDAMVLDALKVMAEHDSGAVVVRSMNGLAGLFSERDFARNCLMENRTSGNTPVTGLMTRTSDYVTPEHSIADCLATMMEKGYDHITVVDQGKVVGLLSLSELLKAHLNFHERVFQETELDQKLLFLRGTYSC
jgi:CBS domain-containing protein